MNALKSQLHCTVILEISTLSSWDYFELLHFFGYTRISVHLARNTFITLIDFP